jgi:hypothetical protein
VVDPEGHPGQHDHQGGREIGLEQEEEDVAMQSEINVETIVPAWGHRKKSVWFRVGGVNGPLPGEPFFPDVLLTNSRKLTPFFSKI